MLNLTNLSRREIIYLTELLNSSKILDSRLEITDSNLNVLKKNVLEFALQTQATRLYPRKIKVLTKILGKIKYPEVLDGEVLVPAANVLIEKSQENEEENQEKS